MIFRVAEESDIPVLESWQRTGLSRTHARRYARQVDGVSTFVIGWEASGRPNSSCEIRWDGCNAPEVAAVYGDCPELNGLQVWPEDRQGHGIGTAMIKEVERRVCERGIGHLGLGVDDVNERAAALYLRMGYAETEVRYLDQYFYITDDGTRHDVAEPCRFLVKTLA
jgi:ribosomal protein S18 acetylase RimI-like enzyme